MNKLIQGARALGLNLTTAQIDLFGLYLERLRDWSLTANLTSITGPEDIQLKHFVDSLTVTRMLPPEGSLRLLDVGSGAGFPGMPLKIARNALSLFLLDSIGKKTRFLEHLTRDLGLEDVTVLTGRAETLARREDLRESFDFVVSRAVAPLSTLLEFTLPFCRVGGKVVAQKITSYKNEPGDFRHALSELGGSFRQEGSGKCGGLGPGPPSSLVPKDLPHPRQVSPKAGYPRKASAVT